MASLPRWYLGFIHFLALYCLSVASTRGRFGKGFTEEEEEEEENEGVVFGLLRTRFSRIKKMNKVNK